MSELIKRMRKRNDSCEAGESRKGERQIVRGILAHRDRAVSFLNDPHLDRLYLNVSVEDLNELRELDCFDKCPFDGKKAVKLANQHPEAVEVYIEIVDTADEFTVGLEYVSATEFTNEIVGAFAKSFYKSIDATFDPLAERHDEPCLTIRPRQ